MRPIRHAVTRCVKQTSNQVEDYLSEAFVFPLNYGQVMTRVSLPDLLTYTITLRIFFLVEFVFADDWSCPGHRKDMFACMRSVT